MTLALVTSLAGCATLAPSASDIQSIDTIGDNLSLAASLQNKYAGKGDFNYREAKYNVDPGAVFEMESAYSLEALGGGNTLEAKNVIEVFIDSSLTIPAGALVTYSEEEKTYIVAPPSTSAPLSPEYGKNREEHPWGYAGEYYMVTYYDLETGAKFEKPEITIFTIANEVGSPYLSFKKNEAGYPEYEWTAVKGADSYHVFLLTETANMPFTIGENITETSVVHMETTDLGSTDVLNLFYRDGEFAYTYAYVLAEKDGVLSQSSNLLSINYIRSSLVYSFAIDHPSMKANLDNINMLSSYMPVEMCDGSVVMYPVTYSLDEYKVQTLMDVFDTELDGVSMSQKFGTMPVYADGTDISFTVFFSNYKEADFEQKLAAKVAELEAQKSKGGTSNGPVITRESDDEDVAQPTEDASGLREEISEPMVESMSQPKSTASFSIENAEKSAESSENKETNSGNDQELQEIASNNTIYASSALSEYLAITMLSGEEAIDISMFKEASDTDYLVDCFLEAIYQNPMVLSVNGLGLSNDGSTVYVEYGQDKAELQEKQNEIVAEVNRTIGEIITANMSDYEKEIAINNYLCETAEYDMDALDNAMENDMYPDEEFDDSFTPYGILVNKVGVCASYASSFKLLADAAGLESVVVTGYLNGNLPHAWNRVLIDGEWLTIDVTNNDNPNLFNAFLNLPDDTSGLILLEDDEYVLNNRVNEFVGVTNEFEYYRMSDKYYSVEEIASFLAEGLTQDGRVALRTDENLAHDELMVILEDMVQSPKMKLSNDELSEMEIYMNLGVISLFPASE